MRATRVSVETVDNRGAGCAATILIEDRSAGAGGRNPLFEAAYGGIMMRDFPPLRIVAP